MAAVVMRFLLMRTNFTMAIMQQKAAPHFAVQVFLCGPKKHGLITQVQNMVCIFHRTDNIVRNHYNGYTIVLI